MRIWTISLAATAFLSVPAVAAQLSIPPTKARHTAAHRVHLSRVPRAPTHFGYYFGQWGWRAGGTPGSWYASMFGLGGGPWSGTGAVLASSRQGVAAIDCSDRRPDVCLAKPIVSAVPPRGPLTGH